MQIFGAIARRELDVDKGRVSADEHGMPRTGSGQRETRRTAPSAERRTSADIVKTAELTSVGLSATSASAQRLPSDGMPRQAH